MKKILIALAGCGQSKMQHPVAVVARAEVKNTGVMQGVAETGDTVDVDLPMVPIEGQVLVTLRSGKRGQIPASALALPDSLRAKL